MTYITDHYVAFRLLRLIRELQTMADENGVIENVNIKHLAFDIFIAVFGRQKAGLLCMEYLTEI